MTKQEIKKVWDEIVVDEWKQDKITEVEDFERLIYETSNTLGLKFDVCWGGSPDEPYLLTSYWSKKLELNIELDLDCFEVLENYEDLFDFCKRMNDWAEKVEASITIKK